jgi:hypothetical protein
MKRAAPVALLILTSLPAHAADKPIITVLDFKVDGVSEKEMKSLISLLSSALFKTGTFKVIDTTQRDALLKEVAFSAADCTDETWQLEIGKLLDAETAETLRVADGIYPSLDALVDGLQGVATQLARQESVPGAAATRAATGSRSSPARVIGAVACLVAGLASGGVGGYFVWDGALNGKAAIDQASSAYEGAGAADAAAAWDALVAATAGAKSKLTWGSGCPPGESC